MSKTSDRLYIGLRHGRNSPDEQLNDWGFDGPAIGPVGIVWTYGQVRVFCAGFESDEALPEHEGLIAYDGNFYGDFDVFVEDDPELERLMAAGRVHDWHRFAAVVSAARDIPHRVRALRRCFAGQR